MIITERQAEMKMHLNHNIGELGLVVMQGLGRCQLLNSINKGREAETQQGNFGLPTLSRWICRVKLQHCLVAATQGDIISRKNVDIGTEC